MLVTKDFLERVFEKAIFLGASDIHFSTGRYPTLRIDGNLYSLEDEKVLESEDTNKLTDLILEDSNQKEILLEKKELDTSYDYKNKARFRINIYFQRGALSLALRLIPSKIKTIDELNLPAFLHRFTRLEQGFILITGPAGHGKSTTMAALVNEINCNRKEHIITIEDPIEYLFFQNKAIIDQREVGSDTLDFNKALRSTLRQDPDVIMVGEMRDYESIAIALTAAETGHLVISTLHTNSASQTIDRIVDIFPAEQQNQIRVQLANVLAGVISQRLLQKVDGGRIPACEILINTPAVANTIREKRIHELDVIISTSRDDGMILLNESLKNLFLQKKVSFNEILRYSLNPKELKLRLRMN